MTPLTVDRKTAASMLSVSLWTLDSWIAAGKIRTVALPSTRYAGERNRRVLIAVADLEKFIEGARP